ncbi:hypothetical protein SAMN05216249_106106 [Acetitomaculum ruminis DSM 5522]|uniref:DUF4044 domain-containing protein n=1 Tax=Acetitomaculum ruminis DSM 5522 TaxID=1120918 RepID=A0A1I0XD96_9FIRM|nr:hypothetical protein SAMN05216249_106106 [Acetitomaculum ruminis DSM 5522]
MFNFKKTKNRRIFAAAIVVVLVLAMVVPMVLSALVY